MEKWIALALLILGGGLSLMTRPPSEEGQPIHVLLGWLGLVAGVCWFGVMIFNRL